MGKEIWIGARYIAGLAFMTLGLIALVFADGVKNFGPWPSYWVLVLSYSAMARFDLLLRQQNMIPPWLLKWKLAVSGIIAVSLLLGVLKGNYLEKNAQRLIFE